MRASWTTSVARLVAAAAALLGSRPGLKAMKRAITRASIVLSPRLMAIASASAIGNDE
jgi:hypothetical protein